MREPEVMLDAGESLLLGGRHELPVAQNRGGGVVEIARQAEDVHQPCRRASSSDTGPLGAWGVQLGAPVREGRRRRTIPIGTTMIQ